MFLNHVCILTYIRFVQFNSVASASCDSSCTSGAGCLGPDNSELCGRCYITSAINSCDTVSPPDSESSAGDCVDWWPPTQQPFSVIFGIFFVVLGVIVLVILIAIFIAVWILYRCYHDSQKGSYNIVVRYVYIP